MGASSLWLLAAVGERAAHLSEEPLHSPPAPAGEFAFWLGPSVDVLPYYGPVAARAVMHDHELWLHPSSLEGRGLPRPALQDRVRRRTAACGHAWRVYWAPSGKLWS